VATHTNGTDPEPQPTARKKRSRTRTQSDEPTIEIEDLLLFMRGATYAIEGMLPARRHPCPTCGRPQLDPQ
jgi:hypothetical protein